MILNHSSRDHKWALIKCSPEKFAAVSIISSVGSIIGRIGSWGGGTGLRHKDLLVGVVGVEWLVGVLDVVLLEHRRWAGVGGGFKWVVLPLYTLGCCDPTLEIIDTAAN